jgi:hypothetical protein
MEPSRRIVSARRSRYGRKELTGSGVRDRLAEDVTEAGDEEQRLMATARSELVRAAADGRFDDAWRDTGSSSRRSDASMSARG